MGNRHAGIQCLESPLHHLSSSKTRHYSYYQKIPPPPDYNHNWTDVHYAASHGSVRRINEIVHKSGGVNLNEQDYYGKTPLYWACYKGHKQALEELLKFGAEINLPCRHGGTPLHAVVSLYPECALILIKHGADVNRQDNWGVTPMYLAACNGQIDIIYYLIAAGADLTYKNKKTGEVPKALACHPDFCDYLHHLSTNPQPLKQLCRTAVRKCLGEYPMQKNEALPVPEPLKEYMTLNELR